MDKKTLEELEARRAASRQMGGPERLERLAASSTRVHLERPPSSLHPQPELLVDGLLDGLHRPRHHLIARVLDGLSQLLKALLHHPEPCLV